MRKERRAWVRKLRGDLEGKTKDYLIPFSIKLKVIHRLIEFQILENQTQFLKHKPRLTTDVNKCNFIGLKGTVSMYTSWGFGKFSFWGSINTHRFSGQWTQVYKIHAQHTVMTNRFNYHFLLIAHHNKFSLHFFMPENSTHWQHQTHILADSEGSHWILPASFFLWLTTKSDVQGNAEGNSDNYLHQRNTVDLN